MRIRSIWGIVLGTAMVIACSGDESSNSGDEGDAGDDGDPSNNVENNGGAGNSGEGDAGEGNAGEGDGGEGDGGSSNAGADNGGADNGGADNGGADNGGTGGDEPDEDGGVEEMDSGIDITVLDVLTSCGTGAADGGSEEPAVDAGTDDAGAESDAGMSDAGMTDAAVADSGTTDPGPTGPAFTALSQSGWTATARRWAIYTEWGPMDDMPSKAIDGDLATRYSTGASGSSLWAINNGGQQATCANNTMPVAACWEVMAEAGDFLQIDLGQEQTFERIVLDSQGSPSDGPTTATIAVSSDAMSWTVLGELGDGPVLPVAEACFPPQTARYVRVELTQVNGSWWSVHELNLYQAD